MKTKALALASAIILGATTASFAQSLPNFGAYGGYAYAPRHIGGTIAIITAIGIVDTGGDCGR